MTLDHSEGLFVILFYSHQVLVYEIHQRLALDLLTVLLIPCIGFAQPCLHRLDRTHQPQHVRHIQLVGVVIERKIVPLWHRSIHGTELRFLPGSVIALCHPIADGHGLRVAHVENALRRPLFKENFHEATHIGNIKELKGLLTVSGYEEGVVLFCALKHKSFAIESIHATIQIGWTDDVRLRQMCLERRWNHRAGSP